MYRHLWALAVALSILPATASGAARTTALRAAPVAPAQVLRLHIVANSTSGRDLAAKIAVRDALVAYLGPRLGGARTGAQAAAVVAPLQGALQEVADQTLQGYGLRYGARVRVGWAQIVARGSPAGRLAAGRYPTVLVLLGSARGQNWWCLLFPQLCVSGRAAAFGFSEGRAAPPRTVDLLAPEIGLATGDRVRPGGLIWHFWRIFGPGLGLQLALR